LRTLKRVFIDGFKGYLLYWNAMILAFAVQRVLPERIEEKTQFCDGTHAGVEYFLCFGSILALGGLLAGLVLSLLAKLVRPIAVLFLGPPLMCSTLLVLSWPSISLHRDDVIACVFLAIFGFILSITVLEKKVVREPRPIGVGDG
jgi:hypothetical protein